MVCLCGMEDEVWCLVGWEGEGVCGVLVWDGRVRECVVCLCGMEDVGVCGVLVWDGG